MKKYVVVGGGIIGSAIAREIRKKDLGDVVVLEKEGELGMHASGRNSGVFHSGINQKPRTEKAVACLEGSRMAREFCREKGVPYEECGTLVVLRDEGERESLKTVHAWGLKVGVPGLRLISGDELREREPAVSGICALLSPTGAIVDAKAFLEAVADDAKEMGAEYVLGARVERIEGNKVFTTNGDFVFSQLINCAGLYADKIAGMCGVDEGLRVIPFRGDYWKVDVPVNSMVYQVPDLRFPFLGVHFTKSIDGGVLAGPSSTLSWRGRESYDGEKSWREIREIFGSINFLRLMTSRKFLGLAWHNAMLALSKRAFLGEINSLLDRKIAMGDIEPYRSGIRAQMVDRKGRMVNEFVVVRGEKSVHVLNAISPGMTACGYIAERVVERYVK